MMNEREHSRPHSWEWRDGKQLRTVSIGRSGGKLLLLLVASLLAGVLVWRWVAESVSARGAAWRGKRPEERAWERRCSLVREDV